MGGGDGPDGAVLDVAQDHVAAPSVVAVRGGGVGDRAGGAGRDRDRTVSGRRRGEHRHEHAGLGGGAEELEVHRVGIGPAATPRPPPLREQ